MQNGPMINAHTVAAMQHLAGGGGGAGPRGQTPHGVLPMRMQAPPGMQLGPGGPGVQGPGGPGPGVQGMPAYAYANQQQGAKVGKNTIKRFFILLLFICSHSHLLFLICYSLSGCIHHHHFFIYSSVFIVSKFLIKYKTSYFRTMFICY